MKVTVTEKDKSKTEYPCLMDGSGGLIVLATGKGDTECGYDSFAGVVISEDNNYRFGRYSETWTKNAFKKSNQSVTLEN